MLARNEHGINLRIASCMSRLLPFLSRRRLVLRSNQLLFPHEPLNVGNAQLVSENPRGAARNVRSLESQIPITEALNFDAFLGADSFVYCFFPQVPDTLLGQQLAQRTPTFLLQLEIHHLLAVHLQRILGQHAPYPQILQAVSVDFLPLQRRQQLKLLPHQVIQLRILFLQNDEVGLKLLHEFRVQFAPNDK